MFLCFLHAITCHHSHSAASQVVAGEEGEDHGVPEAVDVVRGFYEAKGKTAPLAFSEYRTEITVLARRGSR
jgi:hypothetical protein